MDGPFMSSAPCNCFGVDGDLGGVLARPGDGACHSVRLYPKPLSKLAGRPACTRIRAMYNRHAVCRPWHVCA